MFDQPAGILKHSDSGVRPRRLLTLVRQRLVRSPAAYQAAETPAPSSPEDCCACLARLYELITAKKPALCWAELFTLSSGFSGKADDYGVYMTVKTADERILIASVNNADSGYGFFYPQNSAHTIPLVIEAPGIDHTDCVGFRVRMQIKSGTVRPLQEPWGISAARITLYFTDGTTLVAEQRDFLLSGEDPNFDLSIVGPGPDYASVTEFASP